MVCQNLHHAHLQEVGLMQIPEDHGQWSGRFVGIIGWVPSVCKSNQLYVDILRFSIIKLGYIP